MTLKMTHNIEIRFVAMGDNADPYHRISHVGGYRQDGSIWKLSIAEAARAMQSDKYEFYITVGVKKVRLTVATNHNVKYLKSITDRDTPETLLKLPRFPDT